MVNSYLSLTLFVFGILADINNSSLSPDDLTFCAYLFDRCTNLHGYLRYTILPFVKSYGLISRRT